jgi:GrpB-like predicted nucleotidyltransferase (UPF0157 family)
VPRIVIVEPHPNWPAEFDRIAAELHHVLAGIGVSAIDHIGSTAVPGLAAKDVIDIQVTVDDVRDGRLRERMETAGYSWWPDIATDHVPPGAVLPPTELEKAFAGQGVGMRRTNVHFRVAGRFNHRYALLCRDYLRAHPAAAAAYGEIKRNLARLFADDVESYYDVKDPVFDLIMVGAEEWAASSGWTVG